MPAMTLSTLPLYNCDHGALASALDVTALGLLGLAAFRLRLEDGDMGLSALGGDQNRFFHCFNLKSFG